VYPRKSNFSSGIDESRFSGTEVLYHRVMSPARDAAVVPAPVADAPVVLEGALAVQEKVMEKGKTTTPRNIIEAD
jgi:hypothetical protein